VRAGGVTTEPEIAQITIVRGNQRGTIWFRDPYENPANDIAPRSGDRIITDEDTRSFTALSAALQQSRVPCESQSIAAIEAIARVGGLSPLFADPTGVFVFRNEPEAIARQLMGGPDLIGTQSVVYVPDAPQRCVPCPRFRHPRRRYGLCHRRTLHPVRQGPVCTDRLARISRNGNASLGGF
jgi:polysaccharide export outer membrane protein